MDMVISDWKQKLARYLPWLDVAVALTLSIIVLYTCSKHEPWADEAETWVEVRDLPYLRLVFGELRYAGHLPLWHTVVSIPMHLFHLPYGDFVFIGGACAVLGLSVLVFLAPFPRLLRYIIAASFFFLYQYAVVARPYVLMPLFAFLAAHFYRQGLPRIIPFAIALALLILNSTYATVLGFSFACIYALQLLQRWKQVSVQDRKRILYAACIISASLVFVVIVLFPKSDSSLIQDSVNHTMARRLYLVAEGMTGAFAEGMWPAVPLLVLASIWAFLRRSSLLLLATLGSTSFWYGFVRGFGHHQGLITIAFVMFLWAAWPTGKQRADFRPFHKALHFAFLAVLLAMFAWHCSWSLHAIRGDWAGPYSGAKDAAAYLKSVHAEEEGCNGYGFWSVAVQPYFDRNIFLNHGGPAAPAFHHFGVAFEWRVNHLEEWEARNGPPFIVFALEDPQAAAVVRSDIESWDYRLVHVADGNRFFKSGPGVHSLYLVFERTDHWLRHQGMANASK